jgi:hypothetical protein
MNSSELSYWTWFFKGIDNDRPGVLKLFNSCDIWTYTHIFVGITVALLSDATLTVAGRTALLPLAGVFIGLTFAWSGNAQALLQTEEILMLSKESRGGIIKYVYTFQTAILTILVTLSLWGLASLEVYDKYIFYEKGLSLYLVVESFLYALSSLTFRECWDVVLSSQKLLISRVKIREALEQRRQDRS